MNETLAPQMDRQAQYEARVAEVGGAAYDAVADAHARDFGTDFIEWRPGVTRLQAHCTCGRVFRTSNARGLHLAAVRKQADKAWDAALAAHRPELDALLRGEVTT